MKLLHVAVFTPNSTNVWQAKGFENQGVNVIRYDYRERLKVRGSVEDRDCELIALCYEEMPDIILFSKCNNMSVRVVEECNKIGKTVLWYMDWRGNINQELIEKMKACEHVFCSRWDGINEAVKHNSSVHRLQGGFDPDIHHPFDVSKTRDVVFIGEVRADRGKYINHAGIEVVTGVYGEAHSRVVSEAKINISFTEGDGVSNRLYKLLAAKGFVLTQPWYRMQDDFTIGNDFDTFESVGELKEKIAYYLKNDVEREHVAQHGFETVSKYDHNNYARKILEVVKCKI